MTMSSLPHLHNHDAHGRLGTAQAGRNTLGRSRTRSRALAPTNLATHLKRSHESRKLLHGRSYRPLKKPRDGLIAQPKQGVLNPTGVRRTLSSYEVASYMKANHRKPDGSVRLKDVSGHDDGRQKRLLETGQVRRDFETVDERESLKKATVVSSPAFLKRAEHVDRVAQEAIKNADKEPTGQWKSLDFLYVAGDLSLLPRMGYSFVDAVLHKPDPPGISGLGLTSGMAVITGGINVSKGYTQFKQANKIDDFWGRVSSVTKGLRGIFEASAGAVFVPVRLLSIAAAYTSAKAVTTAATVLGAIGSGLFTISFLFMAVPSGIVVAKNVSFTKRLHEAMDAPENETEAQKLHAGVQLLMRELGLKNDERKAACDKVFDKETLSDVEIDPEDQQLLTPFDEGFIEGYVKKKHPNMDDVTYTQVEKQIQHEFIKLRKQKEVDLTRKAGPETLQLVKSERDKDRHEWLITKLRNGEGLEEARELLDKVVGEARFNKWMHIAVITLSILGAVAFIAGNFVTGGGLAIALAAIWVTVSVVALGVDGYFLWQAYKNGSPDFKDKLMMSLGAVFLISATVLGTVFSGGILPLVMSGVVGGLWVVFGGYSYYRWSRNAAQEEERLKKVRERLVEEKNRLHNNEVHDVSYSTA